MCILRSRALVLVILAFVTYCDSVHSRKTFQDIANNGTMDPLTNTTSTEDRLEYLNRVFPNAGRGPFRPIVRTQKNDIPVQCRKLKAKRYLSDGNCFSTKPIVDYVCGGSCFPLKDKYSSYWSELFNYWSKNKVKEYRCVEDVVKRKRVTLLCRNGETRTYKIKVVKSCKCKAYKKHNKTKRRRNRSQRKRRRRLRRKNKSNNKRTKNKENRDKS